MMKRTIKGRNNEMKLQRIYVIAVVRHILRIHLGLMFGVFCKLLKYVILFNDWVLMVFSFLAAVSIAVMIVAIAIVVPVMIIAVTMIVVRVAIGSIDVLYENKQLAYKLL